MSFPKQCATPQFLASGKYGKLGRDLVTILKLGDQVGRRLQVHQRELNVSVLIFKIAAMKCDRSSLSSTHSIVLLLELI